MPKELNIFLSATRDPCVIRIAEIAWRLNVFPVRIYLECINLYFAMTDTEKSQGVSPDVTATQFFGRGAGGVRESLYPPNSVLFSGSAASMANDPPVNVEFFIFIGRVVPILSRIKGIKKLEELEYTEDIIEEFSMVTLDSGFVMKGTLGIPSCRGLPTTLMTA
jgi:hypothetical protein